VNEFSQRLSSILTTPDQAWFFIKEDRFVKQVPLCKKFFLPFLYHSIFINFILFLVKMDYSVQSALKLIIGKSMLLPLGLILIIYALSILHKEIAYMLTGKSYDARSFQLFFYSFFPLLAASCFWSVAYLGKLLMIPALLITPFYLSTGTASLFSFSLEQKGIITRSIFICIGITALAFLLILAALISFL
jgi:hypothetical protein